MAKTVLIAGASRGIGLEMAQQAAARGDRVIATVRGEAGALDGVADQVLRMDVTDEAGISAAAGEVAGPIDLMVCNAGIYRGRGGLDSEDIGADAWQTALMTNVAGPFFVVRGFLPKIASPGGKIAIISSKMGSSELAPGGGFIYRASKAAATNLACNLAADLRPRGIAVGSYHPGWVRTDMGGQGADISVEESARGLLAQFEALSMETTGVFADYTGERIPF